MRNAREQRQVRKRTKNGKPGKKERKSTCYREECLGSYVNERKGKC